MAQRDQNQGGVSWGGGGWGSSFFTTVLPHGCGSFTRLFLNYYFSVLPSGLRGVTVTSHAKEFTGKEFWTGKVSWVYASNFPSVSSNISLEGDSLDFTISSHAQRKSAVPYPSSCPAVCPTSTHPRPLDAQANQEVAVKRTGSEVQFHALQTGTAPSVPDQCLSWRASSSCMCVGFLPRASLRRDQKSAGAPPSGSSEAKTHPKRARVALVFLSSVT